MGRSGLGIAPDLTLMGRAFVLIVPFLLLGIKAQAIDLSAAGGWNQSVDQSDLVSGPGSELIEVYESTTGGTVVDVSGCTGDSDNWRIDVRRIDDGGWHGDFVLYLKRTSDGDGNGVVWGGLAYVEVTETDTELFSGAGNRSGIDLQYKLTGISTGVSPDDYSQTIIFTVVDIP
jgi:hypothetical protein